MVREVSGPSDSSDRSEGMLVPARPPVTGSLLPAAWLSQATVTLSMEYFSKHSNVAGYFSQVLRELEFGM